MIRLLSATAISFGLLIYWACGTELLAQAAASGSGWRVISGVVVSTKDGQALRDAHVSLSGARDHHPVAETITDSEGRFSFTGLADGRFSVHASHRGYIPAGFEEHHGFTTAIVTGEGLVSADLQLALEPQPALFGVVADESGDPVPRAHVSLYQEDPVNGTGMMVRAGATECDEQGNFEFSHLAPGSYYVAFFGTPWYATRPQPTRDAQGNTVEDHRSYPLDVAYPVNYYPDTTDSAAAVPVVLNGDERVSVNLTLHAARAVHLSLQVPNPGRTQAAPALQLRQDIFGFSDSVQPVSLYVSRRNANGGSPMTTIDVMGVAPGRYNLELTSQSGTSSRLANINATSDQANIDTPSAAPLVKVSGSIVPANPGSQPSNLMSVRLTSEQDNEPNVAQVDAKGSFHLRAMRPGDYAVSVAANGVPMAIIQLTASGAAVNGHRLKVGSEPVEFRVAVAESSSSIQGFAQHDGKPAAGVFILLVPDDPTASPDALRPGQSASDGSFELPHVLAGSYSLLAIEEGWTLAWSHPHRIDRYLEKSAKVTVPSHGSEIILHNPLEVQPK